MSDYSENSTQGDVPPPGIPPPTNRADWDKAALEFQQTVLSKEQETAGVWAGALTALLSLFGTIALVTGSTDIAKLSAPMKVFAVVSIAVAGVLAVAAIVLATQAQELPKVSSENWNGTAYRVYVIDGAVGARRKLHWSHLFGYTAAGVLFVLGFAVIVNSAVS
jgi:hypothetical protein